MPKRDALLVSITDEDLESAVPQDKHNCAIVRAIQRQIPEAMFVTADRKTIRFSLPFDRTAGKTGTRYVFPVTEEIAENVIRPVDMHEPIPEEWRSFVITASAAQPMRQQLVGTGKPENRNRVRYQASRRARVRSQNANVATYNRYLDAQANAEQALAALREKLSGGEAG
jgi:hypothetical protein